MLKCNGFTLKIRVYYGVFLSLSLSKLPLEVIQGRVQDTP